MFPYPTKFRFIWLLGFREDFLGINRSETIIAYGGHVCYYMYIAIFNRGPSIDASYQVSVYLAKWFQRRRFFLNQPIRNKNCLPIINERISLIFLPKLWHILESVLEGINNNTMISMESDLWESLMCHISDYMSTSYYNFKHVLQFHIFNFGH